MALRAEVYFAPPPKNEQPGDGRRKFRGRNRGGFVGNVDGGEDKKKNKDNQDLLKLLKLGATRKGDQLNCDTTSNNFVFNSPIDDICS